MKSVCVGLLLAALATGTNSGVLAHGRPGGISVRARHSDLGPALDTISLNETDLSLVKGSYTLSPDVRYTIVVSGQVTFNNGEHLDALYCIGGGGSSGCPARGASQLHIRMSAGQQYWHPIDAWQQVAPDPDTNCQDYETTNCPEALTYQSSHVYTAAFYTPVSGVMEAIGYSALLGYDKNPASTGTLTIKIYGPPPPVVTLPKDVRSPDSPKGMKDRIPPRVNTMMTVSVSGVTGESPVILKSVGSPKVKFDGQPTYDISADGTYYPMLSAGSQTPCGGGPGVQIEAVQGSDVLAETAPFAISSIPYNYTESFVSEDEGQTRGIVVQDGWSSDSGEVSDLHCDRLAEVVQLISGQGKSTTSSYFPGDDLTTDNHSYPVSEIAPFMDRVVNQAVVFDDQRSGSTDIPMMNSGYEITKSANDSGEKFTTCKVGKSVTVTEQIAGTNKVVTVKTAAGTTTPAKGICRTENVPPAAPEFTSAAEETCHETKACTADIETLGRPANHITMSGKLPKGMSFAAFDDDGAELTGTPASGTAGQYHLVFTAHNGEGRDAVQHFDLVVER